MTDTKMTSPLEELRDRLRAEAAQWNGEYKTYGDVFRNGTDEGLKYAADELDKIIEGMCSAALLACFDDHPGNQKCGIHHTPVMGHEGWSDYTLERGKFQPTAGGE